MYDCVIRLDEESVLESILILNIHTDLRCDTANISHTWPDYRLAWIQADVSPVFPPRTLYHNHCSSELFSASRVKRRNIFSVQSLLCENTVANYLVNLQWAKGGRVIPLACLPRCHSFLNLSGTVAKSRLCAPLGKVQQQTMSCDLIF